MRDQHRYRRINWTILVLILTGCIVLTAGGYFNYSKYFKPIEYVVRPGESIQKVLDEMPGGKTCYIQPGIYKEALIIPRSGQTIEKAAGRAGEAVIDAGGAANAIIINNIADTTFQGLVIRNSSDSLIRIAGAGASNNKIQQCTLLEWGINGSWKYPAAVHIEQGASCITIDSNLIYRGNYEYKAGRLTIDAQSILFWGSNGHHTISNNIVVGVCLDIDPAANPSAFLRNLSQNIYTHALKVRDDFGDGYPLYKFNLGDGMGINEDFVQSADFDDTTFSSNQVFGAHDNMFEIQAADRNTTIKDNYIDTMGGAGAISIRSGSIGPIYITGNSMVNFGMGAFKYGSWDLGSGNAAKYINNNIIYSTLGRDYTSTPDWYTFKLDTTTYSRALDGEVNGPDYNNLHMDSNYSYTRNAFAVLIPGSGTDNTFTHNHFSTDNRDACVKWYSHNTYISFSAFNTYTGGTNIWEKVSRPSEPGLLLAGATAFSIK